MNFTETPEFEAQVAAKYQEFSSALAERNRANAQHSTGPRTDLGKLVASHNAVKTGLTGRNVLLPDDNALKYEAHVARFRRDWQPATERESELVQALADTQWRLNRIPGLEMSVYSINRLKYANLFSEIEDPELRDLVIENHIFETHQRTLSNLSIQESRLRRNYAKDAAELKTLQAERREQEKKDLANQPQIDRGNSPRTAAATADSGFVFSNSISDRTTRPEIALSAASETEKIEKIGDCPPSTQAPM